jgi:amidohydrolase
MENRIKQAVETIYPDLVTIRRTIYNYPELANEEICTSRLVINYLDKLGLEIKRGIGGYGVVAILRGKNQGKTIGYRADMDALGIQDTINQPYRSARPLIKHACGHDVHTTIALGLAKTLCRFQDEMTGNVMFIFQPAEENISGASCMIRSGIFEEQKADVFLALHVYWHPVGTINYCKGFFLSGGQTYQIKFPWKDQKDPAIIETLMNQIRQLNTYPFPSKPEEMAAIGRQALNRDEYIVSHIWQEQHDNCELITLKGFLLYKNDSFLNHIKQKIHQITDDLFKGRDIDYAIQFLDSTPPSFNDSEVVERCLPYIEGIAGKENTGKLDFHIYNCEDFARFTKLSKGAMFTLGYTNEHKNLNQGVHSSDFDVDERCIFWGTAAMANVILNYWK